MDCGVTGVEEASRKLRAVCRRCVFVSPAGVAVAAVQPSVTDLLSAHSLARVALIQLDLHLHGMGPLGPLLSYWNSAAEQTQTGSAVAAGTHRENFSLAGHRRLRNRITTIIIAPYTYCAIQGDDLLV